jgi:hypothetical protein
MDKAFWEDIRKSDYAVPVGSDLAALTDELLGYLGSPDPDLRDEIAYYTLAHWMIRRVYSEEQLREIQRKLMPRMMEGIGEQGTDSVFGRSFAALMIGHVINEDNKNPFLDATEVKEALDAGLKQLAAERDLRGWIEGKGWAHSCAHSADLLWHSSRSRHLNTADAGQILDAIAEKFMAQTGTLYVHGEDVRMARAAHELFGRNDVSIEIATAWIDKLIGVVDQADPNGNFDPQFHSAYYNTKNLLRSLYFQMVHAEDPPVHAEVLKERILEGLRKFEL